MECRGIPSSYKICIVALFAQILRHDADRLVCESATQQRPCGIYSTFRGAGESQLQRSLVLF